MARTVFLSRDEYWAEIDSRLKTAKKVVAAIAYFGSDGSKFLPLRAGDELVVDLSLRAVRQGVTNPSEIKSLIDRGVRVFTREMLHAKAIVIDDIAIVTSANVSQNARSYLDEAALLTTAPQAVAGTKRFIRSLCTEPVFDRYLNECIANYQPPQFKAARTVLRKPKNRASKFWFIAGLTYLDPETDKEFIEPLEIEAEKDRLDPEGSCVGWIRMPYRPKWFADIKPNNWLVDCYRIGKRVRRVDSPARVIRKRKYTKAGKTYYMLMLERSANSEHMSFTLFCRNWRRIANGAISPPTRTRAVSDKRIADQVMQLWTSRGKVSRHAE